MDLEGALFAVPTFFDPLPAMRRARPWEHAIARLHDDDWRQIEVVANELRGEVSEELAEISAARATAKGRPGFERVQVRQRPVLPLPDRHVSVDAIADVVNASRSAIGVGGQPGVVDHGFALRTAGGAIVYGMEQDAEVLVLGLHDARNLGERDSVALAQLLAEADAMLVHWCRAASTTGPAASIMQLLG